MREGIIVALIKCPECGHDISDSADICPNCGFALKKQLNEKKKSDFLIKYKIIIIIASIMICIGGYIVYNQFTKPELYVRDFMADYIVDTSKWELAFGEPSSSGYGVYTWDNCELVEGLIGKLTLVKYDGSECKDWRWELIVNDKAYKQILRALTRLGSASTFSLDEYDDSTKYKWVEFTESNYSSEWMFGDRKITAEDVEDENHVIILLKKGQQVSIQYIPTNRISSWNTSYFDID